MARDISGAAGGMGVVSRGSKILLKRKGPLSKYVISCCTYFHVIFFESP